MYDPEQWLCCAATSEYPFKKVSEMTVEELQQTLCYLLAKDWFAASEESLATVNDAPETHQ